MLYEFDEPAPAKVNLMLRVLGRRADGYHQLESVVAFAHGVGDRLRMDLGREPDCTVTGPFAAGLAGSSDNLVVKALMAIAATVPGARLGHVTLDKHLPVAAGIGGGSADAAAVLRMARRHNPDVAHDTWMQIAASLGADVPVCFLDEPAVMTGTGTEVRPFGELPPTGLVLVNPMVDVPANKTAAVFKRLNAPVLAAGMKADMDATRGRWAALMTPAAVVEAVEASGNDLEAAAMAVVPSIADVLAALRKLPGARGVRLSGAGPTCFALFETEDGVTAAVEMLRRDHPAWWVAGTRLGGPPS